MARLGEKMIEDAMLSFSEKRSDCAESVLQSEDYMNALEVEVDELLLAILSNEEDAVDPRFILAATQINKDLELLGDQAVSIVESGAILASQLPMNLHPSISIMVEQTLQMLGDAVESFVARNAEKARSVVALDGRVEEMSKDVITDLISDMTAHPQRIQHTTGLIRVCMALERVGELTMNVAERVVFMSELQTWK